MVWRSLGRELGGCLLVDGRWFCRIECFSRVAHDVEMLLRRGWVLMWLVGIAGESRLEVIHTWSIISSNLGQETTES